MRSTNVCELEIWQSIPIVLRISINDQVVIFPKDYDLRPIIERRSGLTLLFPFFCFFAVCLFFRLLESISIDSLFLRLCSLPVGGFCWPVQYCTTTNRSHPERGCPWSNLIIFGHTSATWTVLPAESSALMIVLDNGERTGSLLLDHI